MVCCFYFAHNLLQECIREGQSLLFWPFWGEGEEKEIKRNKSLLLYKSGFHFQLLTITTSLPLATYAAGWCWPGGSAGTPLERTWEGRASSSGSSRPQFAAAASEPHSRPWQMEMLSGSREMFHFWTPPPELPRCSTSSCLGAPCPGIKIALAWWPHRFSQAGQLAER